MGFDFTVIVPLLPSLCGFSFVFGGGVFFLVSSSVFLLMIVQQLVVILVFSQEGVRACPSALPSWFRASSAFIFTWDYPCVCFCLQIFTLYKDTNRIGIELTLMTYF